MKMIKWGVRALLSLALLLVLMGGAIVLVFSSWKTERLALLEAGSQVVQTDVGSVEFAESGEGPAVLILHGAPGGYDQGLLIGRSLADEGFRVIAPSRPGYLRTPLESGLFFDEQADLMATLMNSLEIDHAIVVGFSTGASVAVEFARLYPDQTDGLVLISPVTHTYNRITPETAEGHLLEETALMATTGDMGAWALFKGSQWYPRQVLKAILGTDTNLDEAQIADSADLINDDPERLEFFQSLALTQAPLSGRESGTRNDLLMLKAAKQMDLSDIKVPTLIIFGKADSTPGWTSVEEILKAAPQAKSLGIEDAGRLVWLGSPSIQIAQEIQSFIQSVE